MANERQDFTPRRNIPWRAAAWGLAALVLLLPLVAMQFTDEVNWDGKDFLFAGVLIGAVGMTYELAARMFRNWAYRAGVASALAAIFLTIWLNAAVGMIGSEGNHFNLLFGAVILIAAAGAVASRLRAAGMARAMAIAAVAHVAVAVAGLSTDPLGGVLSAAFVAPWLIAAALFRKAAREQAPKPAFGPESIFRSDA